LIEREDQRGEWNLIKEGNARCVFVPQKLTKLSYGAFPSFPGRLMKMIPLFQKASSKLKQVNSEK